MQPTTVFGKISATVDTSKKKKKRKTFWVKKELKTVDYI